MSVFSDNKLERLRVVVAQRARACSTAFSQFCLRKSVDLSLSLSLSRALAHSVLSPFFIKDLWSIFAATVT